MDAFNIEDLDLEFFHPLRRFPKSNHSSPLIVYPQRHVISFYQGHQVPVTAQIIDRGVTHLGSVARMPNGPTRVTDDISHVVWEVLSQCIKTGYDSADELDFQILLTALRTGVQETNNDLKAVMIDNPGLKNLCNLTDITMQDIEDAARENAHCYRMYRHMCTIRSSMQQMTLKEDNSLLPASHVNTLTLYPCRDFLYVVNSDKKPLCCIMNYDQVVMLTDTVACRLMTLLTCSINDITGQDQLPSRELLVDVYTWGDCCIYECGQAAYSVIGEFESFVTCAFVCFEGSDPLGFGEDYKGSIYAAAHENRRENGVRVSWTNKIVKLLGTVNSPNILSELFGIRKHWGNPVVDAEESGLAVQERVLEDLPISGQSLLRLLASFNRMICLEYIRIHGCWPECSFVDLGHEYPLKAAHARHITRVPEHMPDHDHLHWASLIFNSNCVLDSYVDQLALISDKSISVYRSHLRSIYVRRAGTHEFNVRPEESRRLMLEFIRRDHFSVLDIFKIIMCNATPLEWLCNSASMKGTEMKYLRARVFAVLTFELRQYFAATEDMLKMHLFKYNPHQTMTLNEGQLMSRIRDVTHQMNIHSRSPFLHVIHIVDFSKWNLRMKYANTCLVFKSIDDFLGTPGLVEATHNIFMELANVLQDAFNPPAGDPAETCGPTTWRMHDCGWEGQRQKGWTLLTSALLSDIERQTGVQSQICGQGDNQVLLSKFPVPNHYKNAASWIEDNPVEVRRIADEFYKCLERECSSVGLKVKTAETCRSLSFFNYGKRLYFNGVELSMTLKRISKTITEPNGTFPLTEMTLKTMEGTAYASGLFNHPGVLPYLLSRITLFLALYEAFVNNPLIGNYGKITTQRTGLDFNSRFIARLMRIPTSLGGPPQLSLAAYMFRGHPDPLCSDLTLLVSRARQGGLLSQHIISTVNSGQWFGDINSDALPTLMQAPYALNLKMPSSAQTPIQYAVVEALKSRCVNSGLRSLFSEGTNQYATTLIDLLTRTEPLQPVVLNDIFSRSVPGRSWAFMAGLRNTTSLGRLVTDSGAIPIYIRVVELERQQISFWVSLIMDLHNVPSTGADWSTLESHWQIAQRWRDQSWGSQIEGVTVPHPLEQFMIFDAPHDLCSADHKRAQSEHIVVVRHSENLLSSPGSDKLRVQLHRSTRGNPYLGSTVSEGAVQKDLECLNPSASWRDVLRLNMIRQWVCSEDSRMDALVMNIIKSRTDISPELLTMATGRPSRLSYNHRALLMASLRTCALSCTANMFSRMYISSNRMGDYSRGDFNFHMPFGPCFLNSQMLIALDGIKPSLANSWFVFRQKIYHVHVRYGQNPVVYDGDITLTANPKLLYHLRAPPLLFARAVDLHLVHTTMLSTHELWVPPRVASPVDSKQCYTFQLLGDLIMQETIVRESMTVNMLADYIHRENPIAISDISTVGVKVFIEAIAMSISLVMPIGGKDALHRERLQTSVYSFMNTFSRSFWDQLTPAFMNIKNLADLQQLCPGIASYQITRSSVGVVVLLKAAISNMVWSKVTALINSMFFGAGLRGWAICSPGMHSAKFLWSRFVELCCSVALPRLDFTERQVADFARDLASEIESSDVALITPLLWRVHEQFSRLIQEAKPGCDVRLPAISFYSLYEPWVESVRRSIKPPALIRSMRGTIRVPVPLRFCHFKTMTFHSDEIFVTGGACDCTLIGRSLSPHYECFFMATGLLSKSHYRFMEIINLHQLELQSVVCLGSSTGSEAAAISMSPSCERIYVNCLLPITDFAPHTAGTYIPPAFLYDGHQNKLVASSNSAVAPNDLLHDETISTIIQHVSNEKPTGVTCDVELPDMDDTRVQHLLVEQVLKIVKLLPSVMWLIIKVVVRCHHELSGVTSLLGHQFEDVKVHVSSFSRPQSSQIFISCQKPFSNPHTPDASECLERLDGQVVDIWENFITASKTRKYPLIAYQTSEAQKILMATGDGPSNSMSIACGVLVDGWGHSYTKATTKSRVIADLHEIMDSLNDSATRMVGTRFRLEKDYSMVRSHLLVVQDVRLEAQLQEIGARYSRAKLMISLLKNDVFDFEQAEEALTAHMTGIHHLPLKTHPFVVKVDNTRLVNYYTRFVFEVAGHLYRHEFKTITKDAPVKHFHLTKPVATATSVGALHLELACVRLAPRVNTRWAWPRRAKVVTVLFVKAHIMPELSTVWLSDSSLHDLVQEGLLAKLNLDVQLPSHNPDLLWVPGSQTVTKETLKTEGIQIVCASLDNFVLLDHTCHVRSLRPIPWSGLCPGLVMYVCDMGLKPKCRSGFPNTRILETASWLENPSFIGCGCFHCTLETELAKRYKINHSDLDRACSSRVVESIRDKSH